MESNNTRIIYFLFAGEGPILDYGLHEDRIAYIDDNPEELFDVFRYDPNEMEISDLLDFAMEWHTYLEINEDEYRELKEYKS